MYQAELAKQRYGAITTEIVDAPEFYLPRTITSNTWRRIRPAIAAMAAPRVLPDRHRRQADARGQRLSGESSDVFGRGAFRPLLRSLSALVRNTPFSGERMQLVSKVALSNPSIALSKCVQLI